MKLSEYVTDCLTKQPGHYGLDWNGRHFAVSINNRFSVSGCEKHGLVLIEPGKFVFSRPECSVCAAEKYRAFLDKCNAELDAKLAEVNPHVKRIDDSDYNGWQSTKVWVIDDARPDEPWFVCAKSLLKGKRAPLGNYGGYKPSKPGVLYALYSEDQKVWKIGITNQLEHRMKALKAAMPFEWELKHTLRCDDGELIRGLESTCHEKLQPHRKKLLLNDYQTLSREWFQDCEPVRELITSLFTCQQ